jgi:GNAT superfamily N-acetyltransferase
LDVQLVVVRYDDPAVQQMTAEVQAEYGRRYGGDGDASPLDVDEFAPPRGIFVMATLNREGSEAPVGMGGWRWGGPADGDAEIKRMYVREAGRRAGTARAILADLERRAAAVGVRRLVLVTGSKQPEAIAMYRAAGYIDILPFGHYASAPGAVHLAKAL